MAADESDDRDDAWEPLPDAPALLDALHIDAIEVIEEITHPVRSDVMHRLRHPRSARELSEAMDVPVTRLYHHLHRLAELGLIVVVATRRSGSRTELRYRASAKEFSFDPREHATTPESLARAIGSVFDLTRNEFQRHVERGTIDPTRDDGRAQVALLGFRLTGDQRALLAERLRLLREEFTAFDAANTSADPTDATEVRVFLATFPVEEPTTAAVDG